MGATLIRTAMVLAAGLWLAACEPAPVPPAAEDAASNQAAPPRPAPPTQSARSLELSAYYRRVEAGLVAQGLLRRDGGGPDTPFDAWILAENFERIALYEEYSERAGRLIAREAPINLHRWEIPVVMRVEFGETVPITQRGKDVATVATYAARLARASRHPISMSDRGANFHIFILNEDERLQLAPRLRQLLPGISPATLDSAIRMDRSTFCAVLASDPGDDGAYTHAVAIIRGEHPDLLRLSCLHEELAQGLGLANDSAAARPSIFNDDEEFATLTRHDEMLLRILYDPRLSAGMERTIARDLAREIAAELMGGES